MTHGSLFSGLGGFDYSASVVGWENKFYCEIDDFCQRILKYHFPNSKSYRDIKSEKFTEWRGEIDVLSGGFPCQPFSLAGRREGKGDDRYLWDEMLRVIEEVKPSWVVCENVTGILSMVQPDSIFEVDGKEDEMDKNGEEEEAREFVLRTIYRDFERAGYDVQSFIISSSAVGAPHKRERVWIVAHSDSIRQQRGDNSTKKGQDENFKAGRFHGFGRWEKFPTKPPICGRNDGLPRELDNITISKWRNESIKALGNSIVPQVAIEIFSAINYVESNKIDIL